MIAFRRGEVVRWGTLIAALALATSEARAQGEPDPTMPAPEGEPATEPPGDDSMAMPDENGNLPGEDAAPAGEFFDMTLDQLVGNDLLASKANLYGYVRTNLEKVMHVPSVGGDGETSYSSDPLEWSFPNFHLFGAAQPAKNVRVLFNLFGDRETVEVRNAYGDLRISDLFQVRAGLMYRRFDLYNEKLDQIPTFLGIEPPEMLDDDHLMVPRNTLFAIHGEMPYQGYEISYFLDTDNSESGPTADVFPLGWDLRAKGESLIVGTSGYASSITGGRSGPTVAVGEGTPLAGILPWMAEDRYYVVGAFTEIQANEALLQAGYYHAQHSGHRDPASVLILVTNPEVGISEAQRERFLGNNADKDDADLTAADVVVDADYNVDTFYMRFGYTFRIGEGATVTPYAFLDWMRHPEAIQNKDFGGENEAGYADNGQFWKPSLGLVFKPYKEVAIKLDGSMHIQEFNGATEVYPEVRFDISYAFNLLQ